MNRGYVKVWRKIEDSGLIQLPNTLALFMHILLRATHKDTKRGTTTGVIELKRGQFISGIHKLSEALEQSERQIRTSIDRLVRLEIITVKATNKYSVYTVENYSLYQDNDTLNDKQTTNKEQADDKETTTKQELNNLNTKELNTTTTQANACPFSELVKIYHETMPLNPKCKILSKSRKSAMQARWNEAAKLQCLPFGYETKEQGIEAWTKFFRICNQSPFLTGNVEPVNGRPIFFADIDFLFSPSGFTKCLENKYHRDVA